MSSTVAAVAGEPGGSGLPAPPEPGRPTDFRFSVRWRSSRKLGCPEPPLGEVETGGGGSAGVFFSEPFPHVGPPSGGGGGGGGGACG